MTIYRPPRDASIDVVYIDESLVVVNKPSGLLAVPGRGAEKEDSLIVRVRKLYPDVLDVHRLDMSTSGLMMMARGKDMQAMLARLFRERRIEKRYVALVAGHLSDGGEVELPLGADWPNRPRQRVDMQAGKPSLTRYRLLDYRPDKSDCGLVQGSGVSRVELMPYTGRTHQLRVHMAAIGHPILGDALYGSSPQKFTGCLQLHAQQLSFEHPVNGQSLVVESEPTF